MNGDEDMGPRSWIAAVLHGLTGALFAVVLVAGPVAAQAGTDWTGVVVVASLVVAAVGAEMLARRLSPPADRAAALAAQRRTALGLGLTLAAMPLLLGLVLLWDQTTTTTQFLQSGSADSCCRNDVALPLGGLFAAWGLWLGLAVALPVRDAETRFGPTSGARVGWTLAGVAAAAPVVVLVQMADWQAASVGTTVIPQALPPALVVTGVALLGHGSGLIVAVGGLTRVTGPVRRHVVLSDDTFVALVAPHHVVVRRGGRGVKLNLHAWGTGENLPRRLHRALQLSGVPGNYDALRDHPRMR